VLSNLHASIQDVFNEHGVQIMSPHYMADPAQEKRVPPEKWVRPTGAEPDEAERRVIIPPAPFPPRSP
jgi:hypothetical protein